MNLSFLNRLEALLRLVPHVKKPHEPLTFRQKLKWTAIIMGLYFILFSTPAFGVNKTTLENPVFQLLNIVFASRTGTLITVGISPIVLASIVLQFLQGAELLKIDMNNPYEKGKFQTIQKSAAIVIALVESVIFAHSLPLLSPSFFTIVAAQLAIGAIIVIYLDETMVKYGITSGINLFIAGGVAYAIVAGTINILILGAIGQIQSGAWAGSNLLPNVLLAFGSLFFAILVMLICIYVYDIKIELPLAFSQARGVGGRLPIPFLYVSVLPVILASSLIASTTLWFSFLSGVTGQYANLAHFIGYYTVTGNGAAGGTTKALSGGLLYLISPTFNIGEPYPPPYGIGYGDYFNNLIAGISPLYMPWGGVVYVPEWVHIITYTIVLIILCIIFGKFWVEMTGQSPKNMADQLQSIGWQIPGFRRDPRIIESILNKYIPTITVLGSIVVALLAALANLTGAIGTGMGILLTVGIMYMVYRQLEQENVIESSGLEKYIS
ncbi:MAG: preprotein translocase subunit SecY [Candidatus Micrarchaeota archaeon]|nr:preprotein translocase subunit SecY [Candidatus Micrarchaeota archaeon]